MRLSNKTNIKKLLYTVKQERSSTTLQVTKHTGHQE